MSDQVPPLTPHEEAVWRAFAPLLLRLPKVLDNDLRADTGLSAAEYAVLMNLSEAPDRQLRMSELANRVAMSASRISRIVDAFAAQGLVTKAKVSDDARGNLATLTDAGFNRLREAYPAHLASVRRRVVDHLAGLDLPALAAAIETMVDSLKDCPAAWQAPAPSMKRSGTQKHQAPERD
ncbi:MarR family winged helix-turn-helix transcriptional regulator [Glycomyces sp. L485]|uniref:MarR family winged helix-turn-helix transcriptional regulator n=1 Tax=Glycomyces sp. L485 TaxID=2909235 RepID=UPI001F4AB091|nr:MarR family winged helix-turn-helix transcriptional regulator [Glycomyces sp. L485]MCH7230427.1 MarR family winged helix-turn-helix transcriptional regulator [Glycomyces sp. L485]